jgi:hypothetical protein
MAVIVSFPFIGMQTALVITTSIKGFKHLIGKKLHTVSWKNMRGTLSGDHLM